ncbi:MAG: 50S ribosomal protein L9 [Caulobacterales bacterium]|jgi:large subunit ribosomal protein L9
MKVVLLERVDKLGAIGDVVVVRDGFARNFLLPQKKALRATESNLKAFEVQKAEIIARNAAAREKAAEAAKTLDGQAFVLIRSAGESGQLYGSVSARDIAEAAVAAGHVVDRLGVVLDTPIKTIGLHKVKVRLHPEVVATVTANVARSADEAERQGKGENVLDTALAEDRAALDAQAQELAASSIANEFQERD